jgi:F-type H+-transporting ATPase subunit gamma
MAATTKEIERRIRSINNTKKITKAMELVSAAKMRKAVEQVSSTKTYAREAWALAESLSDKLSNDDTHPLLEIRPLKRIAIVAISANKGLCGPFNRGVVNLTLKTVDTFKAKGVESDIITYGRKCGASLAARNKNITADFKKEDVIASVMEVAPLEKMLMDGFLTGTYDACFVIYTDYQSTIKQIATRIQLLPFTPHPNSDLGKTSAKESDTKTETHAMEDSKFEPNTQDVLAYIIPRLIQIQLYQAVLESNASEHSARMVAMKNAYEAAGEMVEYLQLIFNRARQASITQEIAEISAGRIAVN